MIFVILPYVVRMGTFGRLSMTGGRACRLAAGVVGGWRCVAWYLDRRTGGMIVCVIGARGRLGLSRAGGGWGGVGAIGVDVLGSTGSLLHRLEGHGVGVDLVIFGFLVCERRAQPVLCGPGRVGT